MFALLFSSLLFLSSLSLLLLFALLSTFSFTYSAIVGDQQCKELPGFINPTIGAQRVEGPATRTRAINEILIGAPQPEDPAPTHQAETGPTATGTNRQGPDEALHKVKKTGKLKKKDLRKISHRRREAIAEEVVSAGDHQGTVTPTGASGATEQQVNTTVARTLLGTI